MIAFRVTVRGKVVATAGIEGEHVLSAIINSTALKGRSSRTSRRMWMHLGALVIEDGVRQRKHVDWLPERRQGLKVGDRIVVEIVDVDQVDEPVTQKLAGQLPRRKVRRRR